MVSQPLILWSFVITAIAAVGIGAMVYAYQGTGSVSVLFAEPVPDPGTDQPSEITPDAAAAFSLGETAFQAGRYRQAVEQFTAACRLASGFAAAHHNWGLAAANLRRDDDAVRQLAIAGEFYLQSDDLAGAALIRQHLQALKARKLAREGLTPPQA